MNKNENLNDLIERFQSNELEQEELTRFLNRLKHDPILRREVVLDKELNSILANENLLELSEKIRRIREMSHPGRSYWESILVAASIIVLFTVGVLTLFVVSNNVKRSGNRLVTECRPETEQVNNGSDNYHPIPEYEILVGVTNRGASFKLHTPPCRMVLSRGTDLIFKWNSSELLDPVAIELFNNNGKKVYESLRFAGNRFLLSTDLFDPGTYYWKIIIDDELISMGRLILL